MGRFVLACVGAVIGAGFASGREVVTFFTQYGVHGWWLIALAALTMGGLCWLGLRLAEQNACWCEGVGRWGNVCTLALLVITGGAMTSASGQMIQLLWPHAWAYSVGTVGTLILAWKMGEKSLKALEWVSGTLMALLGGVILWALLDTGRSMAIPTAPTPSLGAAALRAIAYAAMNMTLAVGVVCRCGAEGCGKRMPVAFGLVMCGLLAVSNALYARHPELTDEPFPIVMLLKSLGRKGFLAGVWLLYLSIVTTLAAVSYALRCAAERWIGKRLLRTLLPLCTLFAVSQIGFACIVDGLYAPAGMVCLLTVFGPLGKRFLYGLRSKKGLTIRP